MAQTKKKDTKKGDKKTELKDTNESRHDITETLRSIKTKFGDEAIMTLGETRKVDVDSVSTGSIGLDDALGIGGFPRGRIIEIFGPESSGKTTLSLHAISEAQKSGGICAFIDAEHGMDPEYAHKLGVNLEELLISQPNNGEQALEIVESLVRTGKIDVIVIDSVAALTPRDEIEGEMGAHHVGKQARLMSQALRKLTGIVSKSKTVVIFINQIRMQVGVMFGCFSYDSKVLLADGSKEKIGKLVNQTKKVKVLSYNFDKKCVEAKEITDWHINGETEYFLQFFIENHTGNGRRGFSCTPDHKIHTPNGWKPAKELKAGDEISVHITDTSLTPQQEEVILASLLGAGNIKKVDEQIAYFSEKQDTEPSPYTSWLASELKDITNKVVTKSERGNTLIETKHLPRLGDLHGLFYRQEQKIVPEFLVEQITPRMIALWYCSDGYTQTDNSLLSEKPHKEVSLATLRTDSFDNQTESVDRIKRMFLRFNLRPTYQEKGIWQFNENDSRDFFDLIAPFVPKTIEHKLPKEYRGRHHQSQSQQSKLSQLLRPMRIKNIKTRTPYEDSQNISRQRFDISVADNHNYFVDGCLVSNSPETTPGGKALKFYTSVRLDIRRIAQIKKGDEVVGGRHRVKVVKNKVAAPFRTTEFDLIYGEGISREGEILALGEKYQLISKAGASYSYTPPGGDESSVVKLGRGYDAARTTLKEDNKLKKELLKHIRQALKDEA